MSNKKPLTRVDPVPQVLAGQFAMIIDDNGGGIVVKEGTLAFTPSGADMIGTLTFTITPDVLGPKVFSAGDLNSYAVFNISDPAAVPAKLPQPPSISFEADDNNYITLNMETPQTGVKGEHGNTADLRKKHHKHHTDHHSNG